MKTGWYWSETPFPDGNTWCLDFTNGASAGNIYGKPISVRCVMRSTVATEKSQIANQAADRTFRAAGVTWQREPPAWKMNWKDAKSYAARLTVAGGGWRLPTVNELQALHLEKSSRDLWNPDWSPEIAAYPGMDKGWYWSSEPSSDWHYIGAVNFTDGQATGIGYSRTEAVRCVKLGVVDLIRPHQKG
jgi:formylglycine-generating enzyme required for sulfatase activity